MDYFRIQGGRRLAGRVIKKRGASALGGVIADRWRVEAEKREALGRH